MYIGTVSKNATGTYVLTEDQFEKLDAEASINYWGPGCQYEVDSDYEDWAHNYISNYLGTIDWIVE